MAAQFLVINSGSSSIKYVLFGGGSGQRLISGVIERIGEGGEVKWYHCLYGDDGYVDERRGTAAIADHHEGFQHMVTALQGSPVFDEGHALAAIGHRVVHGGEAYTAPVKITPVVLEQLARLNELAPLHNPANLLGIERCMALFPAVAQVAVFDTAFHHTLPPHAFRYALPEACYRDHGVRRYGFHGTSHQYVAKVAAKYLGKPLETLNLITLHLGNGASAAAIENGRCVDTSMGMTPLEGLMMGSRSGDLDPALPFYLARVTGMDNDAVEAMLNEESGLIGVCGVNDMREVHRRIEAGDEQAVLALEMFCYRIKKYVGAYLAVLGRIDALVFTGGIGEHDAVVRRKVCDGLAPLGIFLDEEKNPAPGGEASVDGTGSVAKVLVIATDEEYEIAMQARACLDV